MVLAGKKTTDAAADRPMTRAQETEQRLRDRYPKILRDAGLDEDMVDSLMAAYDDPVVMTTNPVAHADGQPANDEDDGDEIRIEDFGPLPDSP